MHIAIYGRCTKENTSSHILKLLKELQEKNCEIIIHKPFYEFLKSNTSFNSKMNVFSTYEDLKQNAKYLISLGGDGTLLEALAYVRNSKIPILGINTGRLGFLATVSKDEISERINDLLKGKFYLDKRALLKLETKEKLFGETNFALNEITIAKQDSTMITINAYVDGEFLNSYWADGLIISTPTGSTAYSLSCGGPLIVPDAKNFIITPIAPHNLNVRPIIIRDDKVITLKIEGRSPNYLVTVDSRSETINQDTELMVRKESFDVNLVRFEQTNFFTTIRTKLNWGVDQRN